jgi:hypothetical protein
LSGPRRLDNAEFGRMLEGTWIATSAELGGVALPPAVLATLRLVLNGGQYALGNDHGTYRVDERASPAGSKLFLVTFRRE